MNSTVFALLVLICPSVVFAADWTPLVASTDFDGIRTDVLTTITGIVSIAVIILGLTWIISAFRGR